MYVFPSEIDMSYGDYYEIVNQLREIANDHWFITL
jgi:hypothetical protein